MKSHIISVIYGSQHLQHSETNSKTSQIECDREKEKENYLISKKSLRKKKRKGVQKMKLNEAPREISIKADIVSYKKEIYILLVDDEAAIYYEKTNQISTNRRATQVIQ